MANETINRLFVYGTLQPGEENAAVLRPLGGRWERGSARGILHEVSWNGMRGYPALQLDANGAPVPGHLLHSVRLAHEWARLDRFEGDGYRRVVTVIERSGLPPLRSYIYEVRPKYLVA